MIGVKKKPCNIASNQNKMEGNIRELKRMYRRAMRATNAPAILWDHCLQLMSKIRNHTALDLYVLQGTTPGTRLTGDTEDISNLAEHRWWDFVWFIDPAEPMEGRKQLGKYLGPSHDVGAAMCYDVLNAKGRIVTRTSVFPLTTAEWHDTAIKEQMSEFSNTLKQKLGDRIRGIAPEDPNDPDDTPTFDPYEDDQTKPHTVPEADDMQEPDYDKYIAARVSLPRGEGTMPARVMKRKRDDNGVLLGSSHSNPMLDTSLYEVEFMDGSTETFAANVIAENIFEQVDDEGNLFRLVDEIVDHRKDSTAVTADDATFISPSGRTHQRRTTRGWQLCVLWKDGSTSWESLALMKDSYPIETAEYAVGNKIASEPAFNWWVPYTLKKRDRIIN